MPVWLVGWVMLVVPVELEPPQSFCVRGTNSVRSISARPDALSSLNGCMEQHAPFSCAVFAIHRSRATQGDRGQYRSCATVKS